MIIIIHINWNYARLFSSAVLSREDSAEGRERSNNVCYEQRVSSQGKDREMHFLGVEVVLCWHFEMNDERSKVG